MIIKSISYSFRVQLYLWADLIAAIYFFFQLYPVPVKLMVPCHTQL